MGKARKKKTKLLTQQKVSYVKGTSSCELGGATVIGSSPRKGPGGGEAFAPGSQSTGLTVHSEDHPAWKSMETYSSVSHFPSITGW